MYYLKSGEIYPFQARNKGAEQYLSESHARASLPLESQPIPKHSYPTDEMNQHF